MNPLRSESDAESDAAEAAQVAALRDLEAVLFGQGGESMVSDRALRHIITRLTDEGLVIELYDLPNATLFSPNSAEPTQIAREIGSILASLFRSVNNQVAIKGHLQAKSILAVDNPIWELSMNRASQTRMLLEEGGLDPRRIERITGVGDRNPTVSDATAPRNNPLVQRHFTENNK